MRTISWFWESLNIHCSLGFDIYLWGGIWNLNNPKTRPQKTVHLSRYEIDGSFNDLFHFSPDAWWKWCNSTRIFQQVGSNSTTTQTMNQWNYLPMRVAKHILMAKSHCGGTQLRREFFGDWCVKGVKLPGKSSEQWKKSLLFRVFYYPVIWGLFHINHYP